MGSCIALGLSDGTGTARLGLNRALEQLCAEETLGLVVREADPSSSSCVPCRPTSWRMHDTGEYSISDLAEVFSVSRPTVYRTLSRRKIA